MSTLTEPLPRSVARRLQEIKSLVRSPLVLVVVVTLLAITASYVHVLHELVAGGERMRQAWRATEVENVMARSKVRDMQVASKRTP